jgi:hypothetical protein
MFLLLGVGACKRGSTEPPPDPSVGPSDPGGAPETEVSAKPDACNDVDDCSNKGTLAILSGDVQGLAMLEYACNNESGTACQNLSTALRSGTVPEDPAGAHAAAQRGCKLGNASACVDVGVDESMGLGGVQQDFAAALEHFTRACEGGSPKGCRYVGVLHYEGSLGSPDPVSALKWFDIACQQHDPESCYNAGVLIAEGVLGEVNLDVASAYMTQGCELGDADSCAAVEKIAEAARAQSSKVPGANLQIGSATVNGFTVESLECRVEGGGTGFLGNMALLAALAERKTAIDKCGAKGTVVEVTWTAAGGKITKAEGVGSEGACVAKVLKKLSTPVDGECAGTIVLGT